MIGLSTPYSPEYKTTQPNRFLMTQLAQAGMGRTDPPASAVFGGERPTDLSAKDKVPLLVLFAMLLLPFDIAVRRLAINWADVRRAFAALTAPRARQPVASRAATPELSRLLDRKEGAVERREAVLAGAGSEAEAQIIAAVQSAAETPAANQPARAVSQTLRPAGMDGSVAAPEAPSVPEPPPQTAAEEAGMSRLMAAKLRARQREKPDGEG